LDDNMPFFSGTLSVLPTILLVAAGIFALIPLMRAFKKESKRIGADTIDNTLSPSDNPFENETVAPTI